MTKFLAFLKNNALTLFIAIVPPVGIWWFTQRDVRELSIRVVADVPIVTVDKNLAEGVEVTFRGTPVTTLRAVELVVRNVGNKSLPKADFDVPLMFTFEGQIVGTASLIRRVPEQLPVELKSTSAATLQLSPLLLNPSDEFSFRTLVANAQQPQTRVTVEGRIMGVHNVIAERDVVDSLAKTNALDWPKMLAFLVGALVSTMSAFSLLRKIYNVRLATEGASLVVELAKKIITDEPSKSRIDALANELGIAQHDYKSNLLLLRLKIENQLRDLARQSGLSDREQMGALSSVARSLGQHGVLPPDTVELISALSRPLNRELHELDTYLSDAEFESMQRAALEVVAILDQAYKSPLNRASMSSTARP